jgi:hypothetical protein
LLLEYPEEEEGSVSFEQLVYRKEVIMNNAYFMMENVGIGKIKQTNIQCQ